MHIWIDAGSGAFSDPRRPMDHRTTAASPRRPAFLIILALALLTGWFVFTRQANAAEAHHTVDCGGEVQCLDQGWNAEQRNWWYTVSQGSRLLPLSWVLALEQPGALKTKFMDRANMERLGYLANPSSPSLNPYGLPIGFAVDEDRSRSADLACGTFPVACDTKLMREKWMGMNCAACHTAQLRVGEKSIRIEGAPSMADFQAFEEELLAALDETVADRMKFDRFSREVLGKKLTIESRDELQAQLEEQIGWQRKLKDKNVSAVRYGHGRLDAQGHILNKVALSTGSGGQPVTIAADAPASYPFVWNTSQQDKIQWNGLASNRLRINLFGLETDVGALVRNTSEVIGVFAHIETDRGRAARGYNSSLRLQNMVSLERQLGVLQSPRWPEDLLGPIDWEKATRGKNVFTRLGCADCHKPLAFDDTSSPIKVQMSAISKEKTDVFLACNTFLHRSFAGNFDGQKIFAVTGPRIDHEDFTRNLLANSAIGAIAGKFDELLLSLFKDVAPPGEVVLAPAVDTSVVYLPGVKNAEKKAQAKTCLTISDVILAYKARPLNGIWATAPYLHNGSVPTLYDLLLPAALSLTSVDPETEDRGKAAVPPKPATRLRPEVFGVGNRVFDPGKVGYVTDVESNPTVFRVRDAITGEPIPGNYNSGHDYGTSDMTETDRYELIEYLKTL